MVSQPSPTEVGLVFESLEASSRVGAAGGGDRTAEGRFGPAAADRVATGMVAQRFAHHPERPWSLLVRLCQKRPCQGTGGLLPVHSGTD
jgi:hypothetical protein